MDDVKTMQGRNGGTLVVGGPHSTGGRPRKLEKEVREALNSALSKEQNGRKAIDVICDRLIASAAKGDVRATELIFKYNLGLPTQSIELPSGADKPDAVVFYFPEGGNRFNSEEEQKPFDEHEEV
ncbi:MAG: DUF5681 domain-containing protein [Shewanella sp.]